MKRPLLSFFAAAAILACAFSPLSAQENQEPAQNAPEVVASQYTMGDQILAINLGLLVPLFYLDPSFNLIANTGLSFGGTGSLNWATYLTSNIRVGVEIGGAFAFSINYNTLLMLPILAKASYVFSAYPFEIPVSIAAGMNIVKYSDQSTIDLLIKPGVAVLWQYNSSWSFGGNLNYWWDMQFSSTPSDSRTANYLELTLCALYHY